MEISSLQENLKNGLSIVGHIAGKNVNLPILNNVLIKAENGKISLTTTDLEIGITCHIRGKIEKEGSYTVESKILSDYISLLPNKKISLKKKEDRVEVKSDNYRTIVNGQGADDFPLIPQVGRENYYKANIAEFRKALSQVIFAVSTSEIRVELSGVLFDFAKDGLILAATDSYRLAEKTIKIDSNDFGDRSVIIPSKTLQELLRILSAVSEESLGEEKEIKFYISDNQILFSVGNTELISRLVEGQYPDYKQIIPSEKETEVVINKRELVRAVKAASLFSKIGVNDVCLDFPLNQGKVIVTAASSQAGENKTELEAEVNGKENKVVVNCRYLLDGLNNINSEDACFNIISGSTPLVLKSKEDEDYIYIIMPIKQ